jgi:hypothetical protein
MYIGSSEARDSSEAIRVASKSIVVMGSNIKEAWIAATIAYNNDEGEGDVTGHKKLIDGINQVRLIVCMHYILRSFMSL